MKQVFILFLALFLPVFGMPSLTSANKLPVIDGKEAVATVNGEPITLEEFNESLATLHSEMSEGKEAGAYSYSRIINRLINMRLILQEARNMGIHELPEIKNSVDTYSTVVLRELLAREQIKDIAADEKEVDKLYNDAIKELKIKLLMFKKEEGAKAAKEELKAAGNFDEVAKILIAEGKAEGSAEGEYLKVSNLLPQIAEAASTMEVGAVSPVIEVGEGFVFFRLDEIRFPENPEIKNQVTQDVLKRNKEKVLDDYGDFLIKQYAEVDMGLLDSLDYSSSLEEFQALQSDTRVIARIKGEAPFTVGDLTEAIKEKYYHGIESNFERKNLNEKKKEMFLTVMYKKLYVNEALKQGIDKTGAYKNRVAEYETPLIFGSFIKKVIAPDIKISEDELKAFYNENIKEYSFPEMIRIDTLGFERKDKAEQALDRLKKGTDFKWLSENAEGKIQKQKDHEEALFFEGKVIYTSDLPEKVQKAVTGAKAGDSSLYESPDGHYYALYIQNLFPSQPQPFEDVRGTILKRMYNDKLGKAIEVWAEKLREFYDVKIYGKGLEK